MLIFLNKLFSSMKKATCISLVLMMITNIAVLFSSYNDVTFSVDTSEKGIRVGNKLSNANVWTNAGKTDYDCGEDTNNFIEYIQLMQATGGNKDRDLFKNPLDRTCFDDYDVSKLITYCREILDAGKKPLIKLGSVPMKLSMSSDTDTTFSTNIFPPDDYDVYYSYLLAVLNGVVDEFGLDEVRQWRFGVMTEYENSDWFMTKSGDPKESCEAYCKLYDYSVAALTEVLGDNVYVGAHSMTVTEGLWDERLFIDHCANGTNYKTGEKGTRICYLSVSFYDSRPGKYTSGMNMVDTINHIRDEAERVGLTDLEYGIDEGRILSGNESGKIDDQLNMRIVGDTWQAAYDARLLKQAADNDIDYISSWGYLSGGLLKGYPTVSYHVANLFSKMKNADIVGVRKNGGHIFKAETEALSAFDKTTQTLHIMAYNFKNSTNYKTDADMTFKIKADEFKNKKVVITRYLVNDEANYFDEWRKDRKTYNITSDCFNWSPDDPTIDSTTTLSDEKAIEIYKSQLRENYIKCSELKPTQEICFVGEDCTINFQTKVDANSVVFYTVKPCDN